MKKVAILQSNYIPWRGYFDIIANVDEFIIYDDVQFTKNDWRNRNLIKTPKGLEWLSIPVGSNINRKICDVELPKSNWVEAHLQKIHHNYNKSKYYKYFFEKFATLLLDKSHSHLTSLNYELIKLFCKELKIETKISDSRDCFYCEGQTDRLISICKEKNANIYLSGPAAKNYIDIEKFLKNEIKIIWIDYSNMQPYEQLWGKYKDGISAIDLIFNTGPNAYKYIRKI